MDSTSDETGARVNSLPTGMLGDEQRSDAEEHPKSTGTSSTYGAAFNILCTVLGTGLLQLPYGVRQSGWLGVPLLTIMGLMACYTARTLGQLLEEQQRQRKASTSTRLEALLDGPEPADSPMLTYGDLGALAYGEKGRNLVNVTMHVTLLMVATIYHLLAALNVHWLCKIDLVPSALIVAAVIWLHVFIKSLGELAILSYANITINFILLIVVIWETLSHPPAMPAQHDLIVHNAMSVGGAFASFGFAYGCHPVLPDVLASMKKPGEYGTMIYACFAAALALYLPLVCIAYNQYGHEVQSPMYETPEISELPVMRVIKAVTIFPMVFTYPLVLTPPEAALERALRVDERPSPTLFRIGLRSMFVVFTTVRRYSVRTDAKMLQREYCPPFMIPSASHLADVRSCPNRWQGVTILVKSKENFGPLVDLVSSW